MAGDRASSGEAHSDGGGESSGRAEEIVFPKLLPEHLSMENNSMSNMMPMHGIAPAGYAMQGVPGTVSGAPYFDPMHPSHQQQFQQSARASTSEERIRNKLDSYRARLDSGDQLKCNPPALYQSTNSAKPKKLQKPSVRLDANGKPRRGRPPKSESVLEPRFKSMYKGVSWDKAMSAWRVKINAVHIGYFDNEHEAAKAYDESNIALNGAIYDHELNFPGKQYKEAFDNGTIGSNYLNYKSRRDTLSRGTSNFRGVLWDKGANTWRAKIKSKSKTIYLGLFHDEVQGGRAYDRVARNLHAGRAQLNFPSDYVFEELPGGCSPGVYQNRLLKAAEKVMESTKWSKKEDNILKIKLKSDLYLVGAGREGASYAPKPGSSILETLRRLAKTLNRPPKEIGARITVLSKDPELDEMYAAYRQFREEDRKLDKELKASELKRAVSNSRGGIDRGLSIQELLVSRSAKQERAKTLFHDNKAKFLTETETDNEEKRYLKVIETIERTLIPDNNVGQKKAKITSKNGESEIPPAVLDKVYALAQKLKQHVEDSIAENVQTPSNSPVGRSIDASNSRPRAKRMRH